MTTPATPAADAVIRSKPLYFAVLECPHVIVADEIVLSFDSKQPGHNALNQLSRRMESASAALAQQHALQIISLEAQADERESALVAERDALRAALDNKAAILDEIREVIGWGDASPVTTIKRLFAERDQLRVELNKCKAALVTSVRTSQ